MLKAGLVVASLLVSQSIIHVPQQFCQSEQTNHLKFSLVAEPMFCLLIP